MLLYILHLKIIVGCSTCCINASTTRGTYTHIQADILYYVHALFAPNAKLICFAPI
jgi:hypothetical protein